jgi:hypothetical protein
MSELKLNARQSGTNKLNWGTCGAETCNCQISSSVLAIANQRDRRNLQGWCQLGTFHTMERYYDKGGSKSRHHTDHATARARLSQRLRYIGRSESLFPRTLLIPVCNTKRRCDLMRILEQLGFVPSSHLLLTHLMMPTATTISTARHIHMCLSAGCL